MKQLEITTQIGCPLMCTFCPQDKLQKVYKDKEKILSLQTYTTILNKLPNDVTLIFAGYNEPFTNKNCLEFIKLGLEKGHEIRLYTTLFRVSMKTSKQLLKLHKKYKEQFNHIWIHLPDDKGNMPGWKYSDEYVEVLDFFCKNFPANTMTLDSDNQIHSSLKGKFSTNNWYLHTRAGNVNSDNIQNQKYYAPPRYEFFTECTRNKDFTSNVLLPNGNVTLCCMDYGSQHILGNLLESDYNTVLNSTEMQRVKQLSNTIGYTEDLLCKRCNDAHCRTPWNDQEVYDIIIKTDPDLVGIDPVDLN